MDNITELVLSLLNMDFLALSFWLIAAVTLLSALGVVLFKNIVHSALSLIVTFLGAAALYLSLEADYLGLVQVLIYGGAVSVLIVFAIMLIQRGSIKETNLFGRLKIPAFLTALAAFALFAWLLLNVSWPIPATPSGPAGSTVNRIAELMLTRFVVPFEIAAVLLLVAMIGAIIVAREVKK